MAKRILFVQYALAGGGIENFLYSYLTHMDLTKFAFEFVVCGKKIGAMEEKFERLGCKIHHIVHRHESLRKHILQLHAIIKNGNFDVVHSNQNEKAFLTLCIANNCKVKTRILHCHNAFPPENILQKSMRWLFSKIGMALATHYFACSSDAGRWLFGNRAVKSGKVYIIKNAIDLSRFRFNLDIRNKTRKELGLENAWIVGSVARLDYQKNHALTIQIFKCILKNKPNAHLLLVGEGELEKEIRAQVKSLGLSNNVHFLGVRMDVPNLLMAMDVFLLPSLFEGFGIVYIEAQAASLPCIGSDIPGAKDTVITPLIKALPLASIPDKWAETVLSFQNTPRTDESLLIKKAGFDIVEQATKLEKFYQQLQ